METYLNIKFVLSAFVFSFVGLIILGLSFLIFEKLTPGNLWKEILEEHNTALAIIVGAMAIAMALIVAAAIHP